MSDNLKHAKIGVCPHADGSGHAATVEAFGDGGAGAVFNIDIAYRLDAAHWPLLREAVDEALTLVSAPGLDKSAARAERDGMAAQLKLTQSFFEVESEKHREWMERSMAQAKEITALRAALEARSGHER